MTEQGKHSLVEGGGNAWVAFFVTRAAFVGFAWNSGPRQSRAANTSAAGSPVWESVERGGDTANPELAIVVLVMTAVVASYLPARRAAKVGPLEAAHS